MPNGHFKPLIIPQLTSGVGVFYFMVQWKFSSVNGYDFYVGDNGGIKSLIGNILAQYTSRNGYKYTFIYKNGCRQKIKVHREVAKRFVENPFNKPHVNHKNGIKSDNRALNLEWCTNYENRVHAIENGLHKSWGNKLSQVLDVGTGQVYKSITEAAEIIGVDRSNLSKMLRGEMHNTTNLKLK